MIQESNANGFIKAIITLAYLEKNQFSIQIIENCLNQMITNYQDNPKCLDAIEELERHLKKKNSIYDRSLYEKVLIKANVIDLSEARKH